MIAVTPIRWSEGSYPGDNRCLAMCGKIAIGAVFVPAARGRYYRWRVWCSASMHPAEGVARSIEGAKQQVETRFAAFLLLAELAPAKVAA